MNVTLLDSLGDDLTVVNAARVSMAKQSAWQYDVADFPALQVSSRLKDEDARLIRYLAKHQHWTPFSHVVVTLRIKMPIFVAREWFRHTVGLTRNETSRRYVDSEPEFFMPAEWRGRAESVKQGSGEPLETDQQRRCHITVEGHYEAAKRLYTALLTEGVAPEQARMVLPQAMMTEFWETGSLAAYARICKLRLDPHAQAEIQEYAVEIAAIMERVVPVSWAALTGIGHD